MLTTQFQRSDVSPFSPYAEDRREDYRNGTRNPAAYTTPLSIWETDDQIEIGISADSIDLNFKDGMLWIRGERKFLERDGQMRYNDRWFGPFERFVKLPNLIDPGSIDAELTDGVLFVTLAKKAEAKPHKVKVRSG